MSDTRDVETLAEHGKHMAANMAEVFDISSQIWQKFLEGQLQEGAPKHPDPLNAWPTFAELYRTMWDNPKQVADMTIEYWAAQQTLWQNAMLKWLGAKDTQQNLQLPHMMKADKRFAHKEWSENALFEYLKQSYLLTSGWVQDTREHRGRNGPQGTQEGGVLYPLLRRGAEPGELLCAEPRGAGGDGRRRRATTWCAG
jgi:polyhydroxyalkanoate synthase subunit PhaC